MIDFFLLLLVKKKKWGSHLTFPLLLLMVALLPFLYIFLNYENFPFITFIFLIVVVSFCLDKSLYHFL